DEKKIVELMTTVDEYKPQNEHDHDKAFIMPVEDVFLITGRGTVATGRVERGKVNVGDEVEIIGMTEKPTKSVVTGVEMFRKLIDFAEAGDNIGALLHGVTSTDISTIHVLSKSSSITTHNRLISEN